MEKEFDAWFKLRNEGLGEIRGPVPGEIWV